MNKYKYEHVMIIIMISKEMLKLVLVEQRESLLQKPIGIKREVLDHIISKIKLPHIIVLTGIRRCGKSTLLRQIIDDVYNNDDFYYINFEDERLFNFNAKDFNQIYEALIELFGDKKTFFIDEIQNVSNFENFVRRFYDNGYKFYITGSNAKLLSKEIGTKLTGRHLDIIVKPFSFKEFMTFKGMQFDKNMIYKTESRAEIKSLFQEYLFGGSMPEYAMYKDKELLMQIYEDVIIKDIVVRYNIENIIRLKELYQYTITNFSNKFSFNSLKKIIDFGSVNTIKLHLGYLCETHLAKMITKFDYSIKKQLINEKKIYVIDNGFISAISTRITKDKGWLLENIVFNRLTDDFEIFYHSGKSECDFILVERNKIKTAMQVTWELDETNRDREINGLVEAMQTYDLKSGLLLTYDQEEEIIINLKKIHIQPIWKWLLE
ncbi:MAG TPA: ATP-binding protein [Methanosarcinaceae archaeon]|nr:ATP-binding protein [Methanosarcinaceae archaeon]